MLNFNRAVFWVLARCPLFHPSLLVFLLTAKCLPILLFGCESWDVASVAFKNTVAVAWSGALKRCLRLGKYSRNSPVFVAFASMPLEFYVLQRKFCYARTALYSDNLVVRHLALTAYFLASQGTGRPGHAIFDAVEFCRRKRLDYSLHGLQRRIHAVDCRRFYMDTVREHDVLAGSFIHDRLLSVLSVTDEDFTLFREICISFVPSE